MGRKSKGKKLGPQLTARLVGGIYLLENFRKKDKIPTSYAVCQFLQVHPVTVQVICNFTEF